MQGAAISAARARVACHSHALARPWVPRVSRWKPAPPRAPARQHCRQLRGAPLARAWRDRERDVDLDWQNVRMDGDERLENRMRRALEDEGDDHETRTPVVLRVVERTLAVLDAGAGRLTDIVEALLPRDVEISRPTLEIVVKGTLVLGAISVLRSILGFIVGTGAIALAYYAWSGAKVSDGPRRTRTVKPSRRRRGQGRGDLVEVEWRDRR